MACWLVNAVGIKLEVADPEILGEAMRELGAYEYNGVYDIRDDLRVTMRGKTLEVKFRDGCESLVAEVKAAYSRKLLDHLAKKHGWEVKKGIHGKLNVSKSGTKIAAEILADGTIKLTTSAVGSAVHSSADNLLAEVNKMAGGQVNKIRRKRPIVKVRQRI